MQYLALIYETEDNRSKMSPAQQDAMYDEYRKLIVELGSKFIGGNRLRPASTASTVRGRDGKRLVTDRAAFLGHHNESIDALSRAGTGHRTAPDSDASCAPHA